MWIYIVRRMNVKWDETESVIVAAESKEQARHFAYLHSLSVHGDEDPLEFMDENKSRVFRIEIDEPQVISSTFLNG